MTFDFASITEVRLASGSHASPSEGMCFMEMAAWFAGEKHSDKPACACPTLGAYGIGLNDNMPADLRDELLKPLVPMIAGTRGSIQDQRRRARFLATWTITKILPIALRAANLPDHAAACAAATDDTAADAAARAAADAAAARAADAADAAYAADAADAAYAAARAADAYAAARAADAAARAADAARAAYAYAAYAAARAADAADAYAAARAADAAARAVYTIAVEGLRQAIQIGPHEGFDLMIDLSARHQALRDLVAA